MRGIITVYEWVIVREQFDEGLAGANGVGGWHIQVLT
jgi:hypothetical protein